MTSKSLPSPDLIRKLLSYEPETGKLFWLPRDVEMFGGGKYQAARRVTKWDAQYAGKEAFTSQLTGYRQGRICGIGMLAHRVIWCIVHGEWPADDIDHINGVRDDNRIVNLRSVTRQENMRNAGIPKTNTSGVLGVFWFERDSNWIARIRAEGKNIHLGYFESFDDAVAARKEANAKYGYHANHGARMAFESEPQHLADDPQQKTKGGLVGGLEKPGETTTLKTKDNVNENGAPTRNQSDKSRP